LKGEGEALPVQEYRTGEEPVARSGDVVPLQLPKEVLAGWQSVADILAEMAKVPVGLLTRLQGGELEVLVTSRTDGNPFRAEQVIGLLGSGSYAEEVVRTRGLLRVPNASRSRAWGESSSARAGFLSYLGLPVLLPGGQIFGTICVMDRRPRVFSALHEALLFRFKDLVETQLSLVGLTREQAQRAHLLETYKDELAQLREVFPICPKCRQIRNDGEYWDAVEHYFVTHAMGEFGHGLCPDCSEKHWGETLFPPDPVPLPRGLGSGGPAKA
jgi:hypothetical protein